VCGGPANLRACAAVAAAALAAAAAGCGGAERRDAGATGATYTVDIVRARFPQHQRLGDEPTFALTVRNAGRTTIPDLAVTLHGFTERSPSPSQADPHRLVWLVDEAPLADVTAIEDTWAAGALAPGRQVTLRWRVTPVLTGTHRLDYAVAGGVAGTAQARLAGGGRPRGSLTARVGGRPPPGVVDPRTGRVVRE
jgi:hypothetical protein